jgi:hypothetical protein
MRLLLAAFSRSRAALSLLQCEPFDRGYSISTTSARTRRVASAPSCDRRAGYLERHGRLRR